MSSPTGDDLTLLGLPLELVQHIGSYLADGSDALLMLRRTCKDLDAALLDQFAANHVTSLYCWMTDVKRWQRIEEILDSRLGVYVKKITFTLNALEDRNDGEVPTVDSVWLDLSRRLMLPLRILAGMGTGDPYLSVPAENICDWELSAIDFCSPSPSRIASLLRYTKAYGISLHFDFAGYVGFAAPVNSLTTGAYVARDLLIAAAIVQPKMEEIVVAEVVFLGLDYILAVHRSDFFMLVRSADRVSFSESGTRGRGNPSLAEEWRSQLESVSSKKRRL